MAINSKNKADKFKNINIHPCENGFVLETNPDKSTVDLGPYGVPSSLGKRKYVFKNMEDLIKWLDENLDCTDEQNAFLKGLSLEDAEKENSPKTVEDMWTQKIWTSPPSTAPMQPHYVPNTWTSTDINSNVYTASNTADAALSNKAIENIMNDKYIAEQNDIAHKCLDTFKKCFSKMKIN